MNYAIKDFVLKITRMPSQNFVKGTDVSVLPESLAPFISSWAIWTGQEMVERNWEASWKRLKRRGHILSPKWHSE